jgi:hypothetical protein
MVMRKSGGEKLTLWPTQGTLLVVSMGLALSLVFIAATSVGFVPVKRSHESSF